MIRGIARMRHKAQLIGGIPQITRTVTALAMAGWFAVAVALLGVGAAVMFAPAVTAGAILLYEWFRMILSWD